LERAHLEQQRKGEEQERVEAERREREENERLEAKRRQKEAQDRLEAERRETERRQQEERERLEAERQKQIEDSTIPVETDQPALGKVLERFWRALENGGGCYSGLEALSRFSCSVLAFSIIRLQVPQSPVLNGLTKPSTTLTQRITPRRCCSYEKPLRRAMPMPCTAWARCMRTVGVCPGMTPKRANGTRGLRTLATQAPRWRSGDLAQNRPEIPPFLRSGRAKRFRTQKLVTLAPEPERRGKGANGLNRGDPRALAREGRRPFMTDCDLARARGGGSACSPTRPCARSFRTIGRAPANRRPREAQTPDPKGDHSSLRRHLYHKV
jgi:hypothetical protein